MEDIVRSFFAGINGSHPVIPKTISGTLRVDIEGGKRLEQWLVTFNEGVVSAIESDEPADCIMRADKATFAAIVEGRMNVMAALLRGVIVVEGRTLLMAVFRRLLVAQVSTPDDVETAGYARRQS